MAYEKVSVGPGLTKNGELTEITNSSEPWATYELADGTKIRIKIVVSDVWRLEAEFDGEGNPAYFVKMAPMISINSPAALKRKVN